jgi:hypothetical protein
VVAGVISDQPEAPGLTIAASRGILTQVIARGDFADSRAHDVAIDAALTTLQSRAADQAAHDWRELSTGGRVALISQTALIGGGALAGVLSDPEARTFTLGLLQNRDIPVPGVPGLTFQFILTGPDQRVRFDLNVGALLPRSWGFH